MDVPAKVTKFSTDKELVEFTHKIANENGDVSFAIETAQDAIDYINEYCDNLKYSETFE